jgi:dTDP-glucose 4,6-dehydratase
VFVEDNCSAIEIALTCDLSKVKGRIFNVGSGQHRSILEIARDVLRVMGGSESQIKFVGERPGQVFRHTADCTALRETLGWAPSVGWLDGLALTADWYRSNRAWWEKQVWMRQIPIILANGKRELH